VRLAIHLFGRLSVQRGEQVLSGFDARKVQELFVYLLLHRNRPHPRDTLAGLLWGDASVDQARKHLRQAIWQLQTALEAGTTDDHVRLLRVEPDWIDFSPRSDLWLDVSMFENAYACVQGVPPQDLDAERVRRMQDAVTLYRDDLMTDCYLDWCLTERERLRHVLLIMLDKLMGYCELHREYEEGLSHCARVLGFDRASERTYRRRMRLHYLMGDRTAALREYERCAAVLQEELGVRPSKRTQNIYEQIRQDRPEIEPDETVPTATLAGSLDGLLCEIAGCVDQLLTMLSDVQRQMHEQAEFLRSTLKHHR
jgi:DNA-binding SARP family transcriptional activator